MDVIAYVFKKPYTCIDIIHIFFSMPVTIDSMAVEEKDLDQSSVSVKSEGSSTSMDMLQRKSATSKASQCATSPQIRQKEGVKLEPLELPPFTLTVKRGLRDNDSASVWNMVGIH